MEDVTDKTEKLPPQYPHVQFLIDKSEDAWKINEFIDRKDVIKVGFQKRILEAHPQLKDIIGLSKEERLPTIQDYVDDYYQTHQMEFKQAINWIREEWDKYAPEFFQVTDKIFPGVKWPPGKYMAPLTISGPYPRFLDRKAFQVPAERLVDSMYVISHEMLHFIFYEYVRLRYAPQLGNTVEDEMEEALKGKLKIPLWELSEVFNTVVLSEADFNNKFSKYSRPYSGLEDYAETVRQLWQETNGDIDDFFTKLEK